MKPASEHLGLIQSTVYDRAGQLGESVLTIYRRVSVAALAPDWVSASGARHKIALHNLRRNAPASASAFGGGVQLRHSELGELEEFSATVERSGSLDGRLLLTRPNLSDLMCWFTSKGPDRWREDLTREIREEAFIEGDPVFDEQLLKELVFEFQRVVQVELGAHEIRSAAASKIPTTYLWWLYTVRCPDVVLEQMKRSKRVLFPTDQEIAARQAGSVALSATLAC